MSKNDLVLLLVSYGPLTLLFCDWFASRVYFPDLVSLGYCYVVYGLSTLSFLILHEVEGIYPMPELQFFHLAHKSGLAWCLPFVIMVGVSAATKLKHWYLEEGDLVFPIIEWTK